MKPEVQQYGSIEGSSEVEGNLTELSSEKKEDMELTDDFLLNKPWPNHIMGLYENGGRLYLISGYSLLVACKF